MARPSVRRESSLESKRIDKKGHQKRKPLRELAALLHTWLLTMAEDMTATAGAGDNGEGGEESEAHCPAGLLAGLHIDARDKLSRINGAVKKLSQGELIAELRALTLSTVGCRHVLQARLKRYFRQRQLGAHVKFVVCVENKLSGGAASLGVELNCMAKKTTLHGHGWFESADARF